MTISKFKAYYILVGFLFICCFLYQATWLVSGVTRGSVLEFGHGSGKRYKHIENVTIQYFVNHKKYTDIYLKSDLSDTATSTSIRYLLFAPSISRLDSRVGNWGLVLVLFVLFFSCLTIIFFKKDIIPKNAYFLINKKYPFIKLFDKNT